jgi:hypothetical protein
MQVIITTDTTLVLNAERATELVKSFVDDLQARLHSSPFNADASHQLMLGRVDELSDAGAGDREGENGREGALELAAAMPNSARAAQEQGTPYELQVRPAAPVDVLGCL